MSDLASQPLAAWTLRELRALTSGVSVDDFRRSLTAMISWCSVTLCLLHALPPPAQECFRIFEDAVQFVMDSVAALLGKTFTGPQATLQWRTTDVGLVPSQLKRVTASVMAALEGTHLVLADLWVDGLGRPPDGGTRRSSVGLQLPLPRTRKEVLISHVSGTFVRAIAEVYRRQFQHARGPHASDDEWDVLICGPQTKRGPQGPSASS